MFRIKKGNHMSTSRTKNASRNLLYGMLLKIYQVILPFVIRTVIIYYLGIEYVGLNSLFASILQVLNLAELGVGSAMVFGMYKPIANDDTATICALLKLYRTYYRIVGGVIAIIGVALTPFLPYLIKGEVPSDVSLYVLYYMNLVVTVLSYWLFAYKASVLQANQRNDLISKTGLVMSTIQYCGQIFTLIIIKNYYAFVIVALLVQTLQNIVTAIVAQKTYPSYKPYGELEEDKKKDINTRIRNLFAIKLGSIVVNSVDTIVISAFLGLTDLAIYQNYYFIIFSVCGFVTVIFSSVIASIGNSIATESRKKNYDDFSLLTFMVCFILCICVCCMVALYQPFMKMWLKDDELILNNSIVILFIVFFYINELTMIWATYKDAAGIWHKDRFRPLVAAGTNLACNIVMVNYWGLYGIILSTIISYILVAMPWLILILFKTIFKERIIPYLIQVAKYICMVVICGLITYGACGMIKLVGYGELIVKLLIALGVSILNQVIVYLKNVYMKKAIGLVESFLHM